MVEIEREIAWCIGCGSCHYMHTQLDLAACKVSYHCKTLSGAAIECYPQNRLLLIGKSNALINNAKPIKDINVYCMNHKYDKNEERGTY